MTRGTDFYCRIVGDDVWDLTEQYEPALIFICLPLASRDPQLGQREKLLGEIRRIMLGAEMQEVPEVQRRNLLCKLLVRSWELLPVS